MDLPGPDYFARVFDIEFLGTRYYLDFHCQYENYTLWAKKIVTG